MQTQCTRRGFLGVAGTAGLLLATGCTPGGAAGGQSGEVNIAHAFGKTTLPGPPQRVVSAGFTEQDDLLALGVIPIATTEWFGNEPFAVWPWARARLGNAQPQVLTLADGLQIDRIAALKPDLIVATNAGVDADTYDKLAAIAPTLPQSGRDAFFAPWKDQAGTIGIATYQQDAMRSLISGIDDKFAAVATDKPQFKDKSVVLLAATPWQGTMTATLPGWRTDFLTQMGFAVPDNLSSYEDDGRARIPLAELSSALDDADLLIWTTESDAEQAALLADPSVAALRATRHNRNVFTTRELAAAIAFSSPLSLPLVADQLPPLLARAVGG
ncbi:ABC transporter substrate-binding protein [Mycolicibacterium mengxianglii]|uniref:ABC transporter substrate-binding protein n=1 Tax=Mycolicibacterium mengxianglii TaxID=2736649 RepID=UPI0018D06A56|nr:ABC transporter substrate-binding protein [Mycolicibacterium mengxianglii]